MQNKKIAQQRMRNTHFEGSFLGFRDFSLDSERKISRKRGALKHAENCY